jgi:hypothetical protein
MGVKADRIRRMVVAAAGVCLLAAAVIPVLRAAETPVPVIYCSDLFHPHEDPDDHFDLASIHAFPELDLRAVILDQGMRQARAPGAVPLAQMRAITGREVPSATGLGRRLKSPADTGLDQPPGHQGGVALILRVLAEARAPVAIAAVGSMRDVAAAFNRKPDLVRAKVGRLLVFIGEASHPEFLEYNVKLDPQAYIGLMRSGLPIYWVPCFDGGLWKNGGHASYWKAGHRDVLKAASPELIQYFIYALDKEKAEPLAFLRQPVDPARKERLFAGERNFWCTAVFGVLAGRTVVFDGSRYGFAPLKPGGAGGLSAPGALFGFSEVEVTVTDKGVVRYGTGADAKKVWRFGILDPARYAEGMTAVTAELLGRLGGGK